MPEQDELEVLQRLTQARDAGDLRAELEALRQLKQSRPAAPAQPQVPPPSIGRRAAARFLANVISTPKAFGDLLAIGGAGLQAIAGAGRGSIGERFQAARQQQAGQFPASVLSSFPSPTAEQVLAATETLKAAPQFFGSALSSAQVNPARALMNPAMEAGRAFGTAVVPAASSQFQQELQTQQAQTEQHPFEAAMGDVLGDVGTLLAMRPVMRPRLGALTRRPVSVSRETVDIIDSAANRLASVTGFAKRLGAQAGEAGFEGALLAAMNDGDPLAAAGWTAGAQLGGSLALRGTQAFARYPWRTFGGLALAHWTYRALAPGGQGAIEDVRDQAIRTMLMTFGLGALAALGGAGRLAPGRTAVQDRFIDAFDTIRRAPLASLMSQIGRAEEQGNPLPEILDIVSVDPNAFGPEVRRRLERASRSEREDALIREVNRLMQSARFRRQFDELRQSQD